MKTSFNISILGGRGFVGQEIIKIINNHPNFFISDIYSKTSQGKLVDDYTKSKSLTYKLLDSPDKLLEISKKKAKHILNSGLPLDTAVNAIGVEMSTQKINLDLPKNMFNPSTAIEHKK